MLPTSIFIYQISYTRFIFIYTRFIYQIYIYIYQIIYQIYVYIYIYQIYIYIPDFTNLVYFSDRLVSEIMVWYMSLNLVYFYAFW